MERISQGISPVFLLSDNYQLRMVRLDMVATLAALASCLFLQISQSSYAYTPPVHTTAQTQSQPAEIATPVQPPAPQETAPAVQGVSVAAAPRACVPNLSYSAPAPLSLSGTGEGLTVKRQGPHYYQVFGDDMATLRSQIRSCGPAGEFAGETSHTINWSYALRADETGLCRVVGVRIGVHTSMLLPSRQVSGTESASLMSTWNALESGLSTHEFGHVTLAETYGARLVETLQAYPAGDCYTMSASVDARARSVVSEMKSAQSQYDHATRHGATQGASW